MMTGSWESVSHLEVSRNIPAWLCLWVFLGRVQMIVPSITFCCHAGSLYCFVNIPKSDLSFICSFQMQLLLLLLFWWKFFVVRSDNVIKHYELCSITSVVQTMFIRQHLFDELLIRSINSIIIVQSSLSLCLAIICSALPWVVVWIWNPPWDSVT